MNYFWSVFIGLLLLTSCQNAPSFSDKEGGFSVDFAGEPSLTVDTFNTDLGEVVLYSYLYEISKSQAQLVTFSDYPIRNDMSQDPYSFLEGAKKGALKSLGINQLSRDERITLQETPGIHVVGNNGKNLHIHYRLYLNGNRLYQIGFLNEGEFSATGEELNFMESFLLLD